MPEISDFYRASFISADGHARQIYNIGVTDTRLVVNGLWYEQADCTLSQDGTTIVVKTPAETKAAE